MRRASVILCGRKRTAVMARGDREGQFGRLIRRSGIDPLDFAALAYQVLNVDFQVVLRFEQCVLGTGKEGESASCPETSVCAYVYDVLRLKAEAFNRPEEPVPPVRRKSHAGLRIADSHNPQTESF